MRCFAGSRSGLHSPVRYAASEANRKSASAVRMDNRCRPATARGPLRRYQLRIRL